MSTSCTFFYGNLLHPEVLQGIIGAVTNQLEAAPAVLPGFTRHRVITSNCPAILPHDSAKSLLRQTLSKEEKSVRGTVVSGLTPEQVRLVDTFLGDKYISQTVKVSVLSAFTSFLRPAQSLIAPESPLPELKDLIEVNTHVWRDHLDYLAPDVWSFDEFLKEKLWRWVEDGTGGCFPLDERSALNARANLSFKHPVCQPPPFGRAMAACFGFDKSYVTLNQGSFGAIPRSVMEDANKVAYEVEASPDKFFRYNYPGRLALVRARLASMLGAKAEEIVLVQNTTFGVNTILRNFVWGPDDVILTSSTTFGTVLRTQQYIHDLPPHPQISNMLLTFPTTHEEILQNFRTFLKSISRKPNQKVVAIIDSIVSLPGCLMPWAKMVEICKEENVLSLVDGAHSLGQEVGINLGITDPDFFVTTCHKWLYSMRGCAVMYVPIRNQHYIRSSIPTSFAYVSPEDPEGEHYPKPPNFVAQFNMPATQDVASFLSVSSALEFRERLGGETKINEYCHKLAIEGGERLANTLKTTLMGMEELIPNMINVTLPLPPLPLSEPAWKITEQINNMEHDLMVKHNCFLRIFTHDGKWWARCSVQVWTELSDFDRAADALLAVCKDYPWH